MMRSGKSRRFAGLFLALVMVASMLPSVAFAAEPEESKDAAISEDVTKTEETASDAKEDKKNEETKKEEKQDVQTEAQNDEKTAASYTVEVVLPEGEEGEPTLKTAEKSGALKQTVKDGGVLQDILLVYEVSPEKLEDYSEEEKAELSAEVKAGAEALNAALTDSGLKAAYEDADEEKQTPEQIWISGMPTKDVSLDAAQVLAETNGAQEATEPENDVDQESQVLTVTKGKVSAENVGTLNEAVSVELTITGAPEGARFTYNVPNRRTNQTSYNEEISFTVDKNGKAKLENLKYGDHVKITAKKEGQDAQNAYFKVLNNTLEFGDFETGKDADGFLTGEGIPAWHTTEYQGRIEVHEPSVYGLASCKNSRVAELNSFTVSSLYQEIDTSRLEGQTLTWSLYHAARQAGTDINQEGYDTMAVIIGPTREADGTDVYRNQDSTSQDMFQSLVANLTDEQKKPGAVTVKNGYTIKIISDQVRTKDQGGQWHYYSDTYTVPDNQDETIFAFVSINSAGTNKAMGNCIDDVQFSANPTLTYTLSMNDWTYGDTASNPCVKNTNGSTVLDTAVTYQYKDKDGNPLDEKPTDAGKYTVAATFTNAGITYNMEQPFTVYPKDLTVSVTAQDKVYDGTTTATLATATLNGVVEADKATVTLDTTGVTAANFDSKDAGKDKTVTLTGNYSLNGNENGNYTLTQPTDVKANITKAPGKGQVTLRGWTYGDTPNTPGVTSQTNGTAGVIYKYKVKGSNTYLDGVPTDAGQYTIVAIFSATDNYEEVTASADFTIAPKTLTVTVTAQDKTYDGNTSATLNTPTLNGVTEKDKASVTLNTTNAKGEFADKNVGDNKSVTVSGYTLNGNDKGNYILVQPTGVTASIKSAPSSSSSGSSGSSGSSSADTEVSSPKTGDESPIALWAAILCIAVMGAAGITVFMRKKKNHR